MATVKISELPASQVVGQDAPTVAADAVAGNAAQFRASDAVAGDTNAGAAAGGAATIRGGDAARLTSGNADGGAVVLTGGAGIGTGVNGQVSVTRDGTAARPAITFGSDTDTGIYRVGNNNLGFAIQGFRGMDLANDFLNMGVGINGAAASISNFKFYPTARTSDLDISNANNLAIGSSAFFTNTGAAGEVIITLPANNLAVGMFYRFVVTAAQHLRVKAPASTVIYDGTTPTATAGYIRSNEKGATLTVFFGNTGEWYVTSKTGTWTLDS